MIIRPATAEDVKSILEMINNMYKELEYGGSFDENKILARLKSRLFINLIACDNETCTGFCTVKITPDEYGGGGSMGFLYELYVAPSYRRKGLAASILAEMEKKLADMEIDNVELYVHVNNSSGYDFWKAAGFMDKYRVLRKTLR